MHLLQDALEKDPANDEARFDLIKLLLSEGALEAAQSVYEPVASRGTGLLAEQRVAAFGEYVAALAAAGPPTGPSGTDAHASAGPRTLPWPFATSPRP